MDELNKKLENFKHQMSIELEKNSYKGSILEFNEIEKIIMELEYHKSKALLAIRVNNKQAAKEYIADTANFLFALGNIGGLYDDDFSKIDDNMNFEVKKDIDIFELKKIEENNNILNFKKD